MEDILKELDKIDDRFKEKLKKAYFKAVEEVDIEEFNYIAKKMFKKIVITQTVKPSWIRELSDYYKMLYDIWDNHNKKVHKVSPETVKLIGAALFYFINPFDLLFDVIPEPGYIDDLYILMLCIGSIRGDDEKIIKEKFENLF